MSLRTLDRESLLALVSGDAPLAEIEAALAREGLTLDAEEAHGASAVSEWLGQGAPGARSAWLDPADHLIAGFVAVLRDGRKLEVRPAPRRAVGPDMLALFFGTGGRFGTFESVWLRVHPRGVDRPAIPFAHADPPPERGEAELWDAIERAMTEKP